MDYNATSQYVNRGATGTQNNPSSTGFDPKQSQFHGSDTEVRALFDAFAKNGKVDLKEFLDILGSTGTLLFFLFVFRLLTDLLRRE